MILHIIFAQRRESYPGEYPVEALDVMDEYGFDENGQWLLDKLKEHKSNSDYLAVEIVEIQVPHAEEKIRRRLLNSLRLPGTLVETEETPQTDPPP